MPYNDKKWGIFMPENKEKEIMSLEEIASIMFSPYREKTYDDNLLLLCHLIAHILNTDSELATKLLDTLERRIHSYKVFRDGVADAAHREYVNKTIKLLEYTRKVGQDPYNVEYIDFKRRFQMLMEAEKHMHRQRYDSELQNYAYRTFTNDNAAQDVMLLINRVEQFTDEKIKYDVLGYVSEAIDKQELQKYKERVLTARANCSFVTVNDLETLQAIQPEGSPKSKELFQDIEAMARQDLITEMAKEVPDLRRVSNIVYAVLRASQRLKDDKVERNISDIYNVDKILESNPSEYISKMPDAYKRQVEEKSAQVEGLNAEIARLQQQVREKEAEIQRINNELGETKRTLEEARTQNQTLNSEISSLRQERQNGETKMQRMREAAKQLKTGLFGKGLSVEEYQKMLHDIENGVMQ